jgi:hypothetical protein
MIYQNKLRDSRNTCIRSLTKAAIRKGFNPPCSVKAVKLNMCKNMMKHITRCALNNPFGAKIWDFLSLNFSGVQGKLKGVL